MTQRRITDDLHALLGVLPVGAISSAVVKANNSDNLLEIVLDLGRPPMAHFVFDRELQLNDRVMSTARILTLWSPILANLTPTTAPA